MQENLFLDNEEHADRYAAFCLRFAAAISVFMWILNLLGFFIVDKVMMNIAMPVGILFFLFPTYLVSVWKGKKEYLKYLIMGCFLMGIGCMASILTLQLILAWACPLLLSCHFYSPRFTRFTLGGVLLCMLVSFYAGLFFGVWDANMMRSSQVLYGAAMRAEYIRQQAAAGDNILIRTFHFYYVPRAVILLVVYLIGVTLSKRTHRLLEKQEEISKERESIRMELNAATLIQTSMLPRIFPAFPEREEFEIYGFMHPAREVGGDFYDFFLVDENHLALVIADVSGKGIPAALFMVTAKTLIKNQAQTGDSPGNVMETVNNLLCENNEAQMFVTVWLGILEISTGRLTAVNAGHEYPVLKKKGEAFELLKDVHGFVAAGMENVRYREYELQLKEGDVLLVYTDGAAEAADKQQALYGTERMLAALNEPGAGDGPKECCDRLKRDIDKFVGEAPQFDDITMLALRMGRQDVSQKLKNP